MASCGNIEIKPSAEMLDAIARMEALQVKLMELAPGSKIIVGYSKPMHPESRKIVETAVTDLFPGCQVVVMEDGLRIDSVVRRYTPATIHAKVGNIELTSSRHGNCELTIDGKPVELLKKVVLTLEMDSATICEVTMVADYRTKVQA